MKKRIWGCNLLVQFLFLSLSCQNPINKIKDAFNPTDCQETLVMLDFNSARTIIPTLPDGNGNVKYVVEYTNKTVTRYAHLINDGTMSVSISNGTWDFVCKMYISDVQLDEPNQSIVICESSLDQDTNKDNVKDCTIVVANGVATPNKIMFILVSNDNQKDQTKKGTLNLINNTNETATLTHYTNNTIIYKITAGKTFNQNIEQGQYHITKGETNNIFSIPEGSVLNIWQGLTTELIINN